VLLRTLYRGDAWQMQGRMKDIGKIVTRNQPMANCGEQEAREYFDYLRKHGVPKATK